MKTGLESIFAWSSHFAVLKLVFIGQNQKGGIPGRLGEQTLPQLTLDSRENAARPAFSRPWCGHVATPNWWNAPIWWFAHIFCWFSHCIFRIWRNSLWLLASTAWFREDSFQPIFNLSDMPRFALIPWFRIYSELNQNLVGFWACFSFLSFSNWAYIKQRRRRLVNRIY